MDVPSRAVMSGSQAFCALVGMSCYGGGVWKRGCLERVTRATQPEYRAPCRQVRGVLP
jgi:hypothetical protein